MRMDLESDHPENDRWFPVYHRPQGVVELHTSMLFPYVSALQRTDEVYGAYFLAEAQGMPLQNANACDYLIANQAEIRLPKSFREYDFFFPETILHERCSRDLFIKGMGWDEDTGLWVPIDLPLYSEGWGAKQAFLLNFGLTEYGV
jgi:hypothetical protein